MAFLVGSVAEGRARAQAPASGAPHPEVTASLDVCVPVDALQFHRLLAIELGDEVSYRGDVPQAPDATHVAVGCTEDGIVLSLRDGVTRKDMERVLRVEPLRQQSGARLLALAVAEFVVASWIELDVQPEPAVEPVGPPPSPAKRQGIARTVRRRVPRLEPPLPTEPAFDLAGAFTSQLWSSHEGVLLGGQLRVLHRAAAHLAWSLAADLDLTRLRSRQGRVELGTASTAVSMLLYLPLGRLDLYAGAGARLGAARIEGVARASSDLDGRGFLAPFAGPLLHARGALALVDGLGIAFDIEAGLITLEAEALDEAQQRLLTLEGVWIRFGLGIWAAL